MTKRTPEPDDSADAETSRGAAAGNDRRAKARVTKTAPPVKAAKAAAADPKAVPASKAAASKVGRGGVSSGDDPGDSAAADKSVAEAALRELWESFKKTGEMHHRERLILHYS